MASKDDVVAHIEQSEFLRQSARLIAAQVLTDFDLHEALLDDTYLETRLDDVLAKVHDELAQQIQEESNSWVSILGLDPLTPEEVDDLVTLTLTEIQTDADEKLKDEIESVHGKVNSMIDEGMSDEAVSSLVDSQSGSSAMAAGVTAILAGAASGLVSSLERDFASAARADSDSEMVFRWITIGDSDVCDSCDPRDGQEMTLAEWQAEGMPGSTGLICSLYSRSGASNCRCALESADVEDADLGKVDATEAIASGRARAEEEFGD